jgi:signal transduction histidine kinase
MLNEVSATDKIKNDFISTVSHELRTPLTAIKGWGEMLRELGPDDIELTKRGTDIIISESERLSQLVEELLNFSRIQNGTLSLRLEKIDVLAELDETIFVFKERSKRDGIELTYSAPDLPAPMMADPNRIKQVFVNILDNAFKYTERGGMVSVEAFIDGERLIIQVLDTGCGIAQEDLPNVKMKFYKANIQVRGSGIGLAVVDELVKMHNGTLDIQSKLGIGTTVTIILPIEAVKVDESVNLINDIIGDDLLDV